MDKEIVPHEKLPKEPLGEKVTKNPQWLTNYLLALATILVLSIAYYFVIALPSHDRAKLTLERQKFQEQQREAAERKATVEVEKKALKEALDECAEEADYIYWDYVKLNGGKEVANKPGVYAAPRWVWEEAEKKKKSALDECYKKYKLN